MSTSPVVTCAGVITIDVIAIVSSFPEQEGRVEAEDVFITGGGPASNAAVVLAKQDVSTAMVGSVGDDESGHQAISLLNSYGVDTTGITVDAGISTQTSCVIVDQSASTRSIVTTKANPMKSLSARAQELIRESRWVHTDHLGYRPVTEFCDGLENHPVVSLDSGNAPIRDLDLSKIELFIPTVGSLMSLTGQSDLQTALDIAIERGSHAVVATEGSRGSHARWDAVGAGYGHSEAAGQISVDAYSDIDVVSTLGAGDVFHGALLAALVRGEQWEQALRSANTTAALSCQGRDGREAVPDLEGLAKALAVTN